MSYIFVALQITTPLIIILGIGGYKENVVNLHTNLSTMRHFFIVMLVLVVALGNIGRATAQTPSPNSMSSWHTGWLFTASEAVASDYTSFCQDRDGFLWVGTDRGLLRFEGNSYDTYSSNPSVEGSISDNRVLDLLCDSKGRVWIATANGLNLYDPTTDSFKVIELPSLKFYGYVISLD